MLKIEVKVSLCATHVLLRIPLVYTQLITCSLHAYNVMQERRMLHLQFLQEVLSKKVACKMQINGFLVNGHVNQWLIIK